MIDTRGLALDQAPPFHIPARFFLTAPVFAILAGLLLAWEGSSLLASRWMPAALAATHLITLGYLGQAMCGALLQMLPVVVGAPVPQVRWVGPLTQALLALGTLSLAWGLWGGGPLSLGMGASVAGLGFLMFLIPVSLALVGAQGEPGTRLAMRAAALALVITVILGLVLTGALLGWVPLSDLIPWVDAHATWGLLGWVGVLILGVAMQVLPLFYVTPPYPLLARFWLAPLLLLGIILASLAGILGWDRGARLALEATALGFVFFALLTISLVVKRGRRRLDPTLLYWWSAMLAIGGAALAWALGAPATLTGILLMAGPGLGLPAGMMFKILPFLAWFHLQHRQIATGRFDLRLPHMGSLLPIPWARVQFGLYLLALLLLIGSVFFPDLARPAGLVLVLSALLLQGLLVVVILSYRRADLAFRVSQVA
jgi:hypothetical protein